MVRSIAFEHEEGPDLPTMRVELAGALCDRDIGRALVGPAQEIGVPGKRQWRLPLKKSWGKGR